MDGEDPDIVLLIMIAEQSGHYVRCEPDEVGKEVMHHPILEQASDLTARCTVP